MFEAKKKDSFCTKLCNLHCTDLKNITWIWHLAKKNIPVLIARMWGEDGRRHTAG